MVFAYTPFNCTIYDFKFINRFSFSQKYLLTLVVSTMNKILLASLSLLFVSGCTNVNTYVEPKQSGQPLATVRGDNTRTGWFDWRTNYVTSIDDKVVSYGLLNTPSTTTIPVTPGMHQFVIKGTFLRAFGDGPYEYITELTTQIQPGVRYQLNEVIQGATAKTWFEDGHGKRVSGIAVANYHDAPRDNPMIVPIVITH